MPRAEGQPLLLSWTQESSAGTLGPLQLLQGLLSLQPEAPQPKDLGLGHSSAALSLYDHEVPVSLSLLICEMGVETFPVLLSP